MEAGRHRWNGREREGEEARARARERERERERERGSEEERGGESSVGPARPPGPRPGKRRANFLPLTSLLKVPSGFLAANERAARTRKPIRDGDSAAAARRALPVFIPC